MRFFPWVSREMHAAVVAAKDQYISSLEGQIAALEKRLDSPIAVTVELPKDFAVIQKAVVEQTSCRRKKTAQPGQLAPIDYAAVNEKDPLQLATLVNYHLGERAEHANRYERRHALQSVLVKIREAREENARKAMLARRPQEPEAVSDAPQHIKDLVAAAEKGE